MTKLIETIGQELGVRAEQVDAAVRLLDEGATVPFIARYRKEATGGLDDTQLRRLDERLHYLRELEERRGVVLASIEEQGKLDADLRAAIEATATKQQLEDLYLPYKPKRRTKAQLAREAGLGPLAEDLLADPTREPLAEAFAYVDPDKGVADAAAALDGARHILMERFAEDPALAGELRERLWEQGVMVSRVVEGKEQEGKKFSDYFDYREPVAKIPSHRALALFRGRKQGALSLELLPEDTPDPDAYYRSRVAAHFGIRSEGNAGDYWLEETVRKAWRAKLFTRLELDIKNRLMDAAQAEAIRVFALNLKALLLAAPAGGRTTLGLDPGLRTGVKVAVVDTTGRLVDTATIYPHAPRNQWDAAIARLAELCKKHDVQLVSIGNGTASRETDRLVRELIRGQPELGLRSQMVNEAGASVYSASELASREFPDIDVSLRGAVSIARRLQDPLAELVKIEPKSIGVGQYQHDVNQSHLARTLDTVVEDCVNAVGVDLNTASVALLTRVSGLNRGLAEHIVGFRESNGAFSKRVALMAVPRFGDKAFQQSAGFLRIRDGEEPLDRSAVHPEAYPVVRRICDHTGKDVGSLMGDTATLQALDPAAFVDDSFGVPTVKDILAELEKPGRDPRPEFRTADHREGIESLEDLKPDMVLEGTVTNVTNFGAFVDIGVHQDGLVHISRLAEGFVKDPHTVVKSGQLVKVKVLEVDLARRRIALSMRLREASEAPSASGEGRARAASEGKPPPRPRARQPEQKRRETARREDDKGRSDNGRSALEGAFAAAFERARKQ